MFLDPNIKRKSTIIDEHLSVQHDISGVPTFSVIEFNISELCNRTCEFCPRADPAVYPNRNLFMTRALMAKIATELGSFDYSGKALFSAFSEPFLHKELEDFIGLIRKHCPRCRIEVVTNGDFVTPERVRALFDSGLTALLVSMYDGPHQEAPLAAVRDEVGLTEDQFILRVRYLSKEEGFGLTMSNRAGFVDTEALGSGKQELPLARPCFYPHYQMTVDFDGSVLLCPHDWGKRIRAGNLNDETILDVWNSKALTFARHKLGCADRDFAPCNACDVTGDLMGRHHYEAWRDHYSTQGAHGG